jgi:hypothetical protein
MRQPIRSPDEQRESISHVERKRTIHHPREEALATRFVKPKAFTLRDRHGEGLRVHAHENTRAA